jgi:RNA polymerase sigma factor (sigma-70 family)
MVTGEALEVRGRLESLYSERYGEFVRAATAILGSELAGIDAVQEAFARALARLDTFEGRGPLAGWVWRIVINTARSATRSMETPTERLEPSANGSSTAVVEDSSSLRQAISALPERQRLAVFLRYYADLDYRGIAEALEIEVGTVSATLNAAHERLRQLQEVTE